ncbi:Fungal potassium channel [Teratosphaeria destructans]|uniref:Fungal potassium channel n=1 Tax=Teratosphaeria destructans TaxID=418781 RepID=A0A9W7SW96_9PEZI|nr:Fungal potassium channel [Teratosphaeria destructans]
MCCGGDRDKGPPEYTQKWEFITLSDFRHASFWTYLAYGWLWFMAFVAVAVYTLDTYTAINLLAFNTWSSSVKATLSIKYTKWIFSGCIILSWLLCMYGWLRAIRVIRRGGVAESYMDPLAVTLQSMRSQGWRRFLVFTELTKSKKGVDYIAFFVYFAFQGAIRVILAEGPRQAVNAYTLYSVMDAKIEVHHGPSDGHSSIQQFFINLQSLANENTRQTLIYCAMLTTLVIWVFSALSLIIATILYLIFLWHYIPQRDGRLKVFCRRKIDKRLEKVVEHKIKAALEEEEAAKRREARKIERERKKNGEAMPSPKMLGDVGRQPTLPQLDGTPNLSRQPDETKDGFGLVRRQTNTTMTTLPPYSSRPPTRNQMERQPTLPDIDRPPMPNRAETEASAWTSRSYESGMPLLSNAGYAGGDGRGTPGMPPSARQHSIMSFQSQRPMRDMDGSQASMQQRSFTPTAANGSNGSMYGRPPTRGHPGPGMRGPPPGPGRFPPRSNTGGFEDGQRSVSSPMGPPPHPNTAIGFGQAPMGGPAPYTPGAMGPPPRSNTGFGYEPASTSRQSPASMRPPPRSNTSQGSGAPGGGLPPLSRQQTFGSLHSQQNSFSRPTPPPQRKRTDTSFNQPSSFSAEPESYEMTSHPFTNPVQKSPMEISSGSGAQSVRTYTPFNPSRMNTASPAPPPSAPLLPSGLQPGPKRTITLAGGPGTEDSYFGSVQHVPQRNVTAPVVDNNRLTVVSQEARISGGEGYGDIFDAYGGPSERNSMWPSDSSGSPEEARAHQGARGGYGGPGGRW